MAPPRRISNPPNPWDSTHVEYLGEPPEARLEVFEEEAKSILETVVSSGTGTNAQIGAELFISPKTVDTYKQRIEEKIGLSHRTEYVRFALEAGLLSK